MSIGIYEKARRVPGVRAVARVTLIVVLVALAVGYIRLDDDAREDRGTTDAAVAILASSCGAASFADLRAAGLLEECRLARSGDLPAALPDAVAENGAPEADAADVIPDDPDVSPDQVTREPTEDEIRAAVEPQVTAYFEANPLPTASDYQQSIRRSVVRFLTANPPAPGPGPSDEQVQTAVRDALLANPPDEPTDGTNGTNGTDGTDGDDGQTGPAGPAGRGIAQASLDGCDVVFTYSTGATDRVGPLCAPPPSDQQIAQAFAAYCDANGQCRGPSGIVQIVDDCTPTEGGRFLTDAALSYDAATSTLTLTCDAGGLLNR